MAIKVTTEFHPPAQPVYASYDRRWEGDERIPLTAEEQSKIIYDIWMAIQENIRYFDSKLLGEIYTLLEIAIPDDRQREALKTQIKNATFRWQSESFKVIGNNFDLIPGVVNLDQHNRNISSFGVTTDSEGNPVI